LQFINFSRPQPPHIVHLGCRWGDSWLDVTQAVVDGVVPFPLVVTTIEDLLWTENGLQKMEGVLQALEKSKTDVKKLQFLESDVILECPVFKPQKVIGIGLN